MNYTNIEQSKKLVELGLNPLTSDMSYSYDFDDSRYVITTTPVKNWIVPKYAESTKIKQVLPCWSFEALLKVMPISIEEVKDHKVDLILGHPKDKWCLAYFDWTGLQQGHSTTGDTPLEAAYNMAVWLLENGYLMKE